MTQNNDGATLFNIEKVPFSRFGSYFAMAVTMSPHAVQIALEPLRGTLNMDAPWSKGKGIRRGAGIAAAAQCANPSG